MYASLGRLLAALNIAASFLTLGLILLIGVDVFGRWLAGYPLQGVPEIAKLAIVCIVWLQMGYTLHIRKHLRADTLLQVMPLGGRRTVAALNALGGLFIFAVIAYAGYWELLRSWTGGIFEGEHPVRVPVWPVWLVITLGAALTAIEYAVQFSQAAGFGTYRDDSGGSEIS
jgi:TRAP-type C4-dicarboxylate transport system permease small subunit